MPYYGQKNSGEAAGFEFVCAPQKDHRPKGGNPFTR
jgi:hypothetical protein